MVNEEFNRQQILEKINTILEIQEIISGFIGKQLCDYCNSPDEYWEEKRKEIIKHLKNLASKYDFTMNLPKNNLGIAALAILGYLQKIQRSHSHVVIMIDMIRGESFGEIFLDSMNAISTKTHQEFTTLKNLVRNRLANPELAIDSFNTILRLEREIDEDNIVICRQISAVSNEGEADYICYVMRKIVSELEHISDFIKEAAEVIIDI